MKFRKPTFKYILFAAVIFLPIAKLLAAQDKMNLTIAPNPQPQPANTVTFHIPGPTLISPIQETVDITGAESLEFSWKPGEAGSDIYCYLFRIYRGHDMTQKGEVYSQQVSALDTSMEVSSDYFKDGETYTWLVKQVNNGPKLLFSDPVFWSFEIVKKDSPETEITD